MVDAKKKPINEIKTENIVEILESVDKATKWSVEILLQNKVLIQKVIVLSDLKQIITLAKKSGIHYSIKPLHPWIVLYVENEIKNRFDGVPIAKITIKPLN